MDEFGGRQKKAKSASADEKQQGWETTPKNEIPKGLKEEMDKEFAEAFGLEIDEGLYSIKNTKTGQRYSVNASANSLSILFPYHFHCKCLGLHKPRFVCDHFFKCFFHIWFL